MGIEEQKKLTDGKGWKFVKNYAKEKKEQITTKAKNIAGGVNVVTSKILDVVTPTTVKKVSEKIQKIKDKKKRGPRDE